jgi:hypothetical protein
MLPLHPYIELIVRVLIEFLFWLVFRIWLF